MLPAEATTSDNDQLKRQLAASEARTQRALGLGTVLVVLGFFGVAEVLLLQHAYAETTALRDHQQALIDWAPNVWARQDRVIAEVTELTGPIDLVDQGQMRFESAETVGARLKANDLMVRGLREQVAFLPRDSAESERLVLGLEKQVDDLGAMAGWLDDQLTQRDFDWAIDADDHASSLLLGLHIVTRPEWR